MAKRRRSSASSELARPISKKVRTIDPDNHLSSLSSELLIRILHLLPLPTLLRVQLLSHRFYTLAGDSQIWKNLYYTRFVLPRALRIPGLKANPFSQKDDRLHFSSRRSKWLDEDVLVHGKGGKTTNWKKQYKLRHNWSIGACEVQEIHVADRPSVPEMLVQLAEGVVVTADQDEGLRAWDLKERKLIAKFGFDQDVAPTCLAVDEQGGDLGIAVGFEDGGWGTWKLEMDEKIFSKVYRHPASSNGMLGAIAHAHPYVLTITDAQLLSLYTFEPKLTPPEPPLDSESPSQVEHTKSSSEPQAELVPLRSQLAPSDPTLLASLKSHTSWPPLSLSIRTTPSTLIASIAYSLPTYLSGYAIGLQELHLSLSSGLITFSRLASSLPQGFSSLLPPSIPNTTSSTTLPPPPTSPNPGTALGGLTGTSTRPTSLSYSHPYILATHPDNTLTLYLSTSTSDTLSITPGTKLWGHTSSVSSASITPRGKAVSVSTRGNELRVWELEGGGLGAPSRRRVPARSSLAAGGADKSVRIRGRDAAALEEPEPSGDKIHALRRWGEDVNARKQWVGFDDEVVIVLKESGRGAQALMVYDFT